MTPGEGYMYHSHATEGFTFHYPDAATAKFTNSVSSSTAQLTNTKSSTRSPQHEVTNTCVFLPVTDPYSGNMSIIARVMNGDEAVHGVEVGIFAGDECRGAATEDGYMVNDQMVNDFGYWFLTVAGDEAAPLTIKIYDPATSETITVQQTLTYTDDATLGSLDEPYIIQLNVADGIQEVDASQIVNGKSSNRKLIIDGILYILRNGEKYDATGKRVSEK